MTQRKKTIKLSQLEKQFNDSQKLKSFVINHQTGETVKYYAKFDRQKIEELIKELHSHLLYAQQKKIDYLTNDDEFLKYAFYLIIKHFSHFKDEIDDKFENNIYAMNLLLSTGLFERFFKDVFDMNEVFEVIDKINEVFEVALKIQDLETKKQDEILKKVNNPEILSVEEVDGDATV